jgi:hypothetical protein
MLLSNNRFIIPSTNLISSNLSRQNGSGSQPAARPGSRLRIYSSRQLFPSALALTPTIKHIAFFILDFTARGCIQMLSIFHTPKLSQKQECIFLF